MFFDNWFDLLRVLLMTLTSYGATVLILRVSGARALSKLNAFDFVVTIALGSILASTILLKDISLTEGILALLGLVGLQWIVTRCSNLSQRFANIFRSQPRLLLRDGDFIDRALAEERVTCNEVEAAIRKKGHGRIEEVTAVVLESDGTLSVICEGSAADCTALRTVSAPREGEE